jgi:hypothetical protein
VVLLAFAGDWGGSETRLLTFVFSLAKPLEDGESSLLGVGDGDGFGFGWGMDLGDDFANRFFAEGTLGQRRCADRTAQGELSATDGAISVAEFIFVKGHEGV